jgi:hypothetical protein
MPNGWHFNQPLNDGTLQRLPPVEGSIGAYEELLQYVLTWRLENNYPVGDVRGDVDNYICTNFPRQCNQISIQSYDVLDNFLKNPPGTRFIDKIIDWATGYAYRTVEVVHKATADQRSLSCIGCQYNKDWENSCPQCVTKAYQLLGLIRKGKEAERWRKLKACHLFGHCNRTAVWLKKKELPLSSHVPPPNCWIQNGGDE